MSYEYMLGFGDDEPFELGVKVAGSGRMGRPRGGKTQRSRQQRPQLSREEQRTRTKASCGGIGCPEGLRNRIFREEDNPLRRAELQEDMEGRGCSLLCTVGNSSTYCCPSGQTTQELVTDPFATDPTMLESVATSIEARPDIQSPNGAVSNGQNGRSSVALMAILGAFGLTAAGVVGYVVFGRKRKKRKRKKGKS